MLKDHAWIAAHIPHSGTMCLIDEVVDWDRTRARCRSSGHRSLGHPLRAHGRLGVVCGIEIAAQAMAVHGALLAPTPDGSCRVGYLAALRDVKWRTERLDDITGDLLAAVERLAGDESSSLYQFTVSSNSVTLLSGRAMIVRDAAGSVSPPVSVST